MEKTATTTIVNINKPLNTICGGFIDVNGIWNNGFACPIKNLVQYYCCGTDNYHYCCPYDDYLSEINSLNDQIYITGQYQPSSQIILDENTRNYLINKSNMINKQFEQFQKLFLPIFLLTSSILFLVGIAIWFWLYKHKAFYAIERDDLNEHNRVIARIIQPIPIDLGMKKRDSINLTMEEQSRQISHPSTEV